MTLDGFNKKFRGQLNIELTKEPITKAPLANQFASSDSKVRSISLEVYVDNDKNLEYGTDYFRDPSETELSQIVLKVPEIELLGEAKIVVTCKAPNGKHFTARDLLNAVEEVERQTRWQSNWFGGIDVHHVYFEGVHEIQSESEVYEIEWGS